MLLITHKNGSDGIYNVKNEVFTKGQLIFLLFFPPLTQLRCMIYEPPLANMILIQDAALVNTNPSKRVPV